MTKREEILHGARSCICEDRNAQYGEPENNFGAIARLWSEYLDMDVSAHDVGMMMALFKIARIKTAQKKTKEDSYVDAVGYIACAGEIALQGGQKT